LSHAGATFEGTCFRHCRAQYATVDEGTLEASARVGGRFNPPGEFGAIYVALDRETAVAEFERRVTESGLPREHFHPRVVLRLRARLSRVLDLTDDAVRGSLGMTLQKIVGEDWSPTHAAGRQARTAGYSAVRFPSATGKGQNLAIFLDVLPRGDHVTMEGLQELDPAP